VATFKNADELYGIIGSFLSEVTQQPDMRPKFVESKIAALINYTDPAARILLDCTTDPPTVVNDPPADVNAEINLTMTADDANKFWQGKLNVPVAFAKRRVKVNGSIGKMMKLLPAFQPSYARYRSFLETNGHTDKLI
jgi:putative sterol carrier protein